LHKFTALRYFLELSYNGTAYHGWQRQPNALSVQQVLEEALTTLLGTETAIVGAGRTDTGVHAKQLYAHFDADISVEEAADLAFRLNRFLPKDIAICAIHAVNCEAHARFDATSRSYEYHITQKKDPFGSEFTYHFNLPLDLDAMNTAAAVLLKHTNFKCFSRSKTDVKTYECEVTEAFWKQQNHKLIFYISANRFLRNMVRAIVGTLLDVGTGKCSLSDFQSILDSQDRTKAGSSAPAHGLFLTRVHYSNTIFVARGKEINK
jgi:tRNA pseudouridine38-40 synthase